MSRELDAKVAIAQGWRFWLKKNQGLYALFPPENDPEWRPTNWHPDRFEKTEYAYSDVADKLFSDWDLSAVKNGDFAKRGLPHFSTDYNDAFGLVEEMGKTADIEISRMPRSWCVAWVDTSNPDNYGRWSADTAQQAICHAYLKWKEG